MEPIRIFVASSSEREPLAQEFATLVETALGTGAMVELWRSKFDFSDTAIESLESIAEEADFAIIVMTGDDVTISRDKESMSPRDNLVLELGLFIGALGRKRSFVLREDKNNLKLPTDILGITVVTFNNSSAAELTKSLQTQSRRLAAQITKSGIRPKWLA